MIRKVAFFAYPLRNFDRGKQFFGEILGLEHDGDPNDRWTEFTTPDGKSIALDGYSPDAVEHPTPYLALETDDIEAEVKRLKERGVRVARDVWTNYGEQDREVCRMAVILDPEGNAVMLHETADWRREG